MFIEDIKDMLEQGATQSEIDFYLDYQEEWEEINQDNWEF